MQLPSRSRICDAKRVAYPSNVDMAVVVPVDTDDVEAAAVMAEARMPRQVDGGGLCQFSLFADIDSRYRIDERPATPVADFDKDQTVAVEHDQVDLAVAAVVVSGDRLQTRTPEFVQSEILGLVAAQSSSGSSHGSSSVSSASSGGSSSPCSLMSWIGPPIGSGSGSATGRPLWNCAHASRRCTWPS